MTRPPPLALHGKLGNTLDQGFPNLWATGRYVRLATSVHRPTDVSIVVGIHGPTHTRRKRHGHSWPHSHEQGLFIHMHMHVHAFTTPQNDPFFPLSPRAGPPTLNVWGILSSMGGPGMQGYPVAGGGSPDVAAAIGRGSRTNSLMHFSLSPPAFVLQRASTAWTLPVQVSLFS